jgi:hypothetical protein
VEERSRSQLLQRNEQIRALSTLGMNLGTGLIIAGSGRWFFERFDEHVIFWFTLGSVVIWLGVKGLILLEAEN